MSKLLEIRGKHGSIIGNYAIVDNYIYDELTKYKWYAIPEQKANGEIVYYVARDDNGTTIRLHRHILKVTNTKIQVDHINRNPLDCRIENMRICTQSQNQANTGKKIHTGTLQSQYKGVSKCENGNNCFKSSITNPNNGQREYLGRFDSEEKAATAYDIKAIEYYGEFAYLNFPNKDYSIVQMPEKINQTSNTGHKNIYIHSNGGFYVRKVINGIEYSKHFRNIEDAKTYLNQIIHENKMS